MYLIYVPMPHHDTWYARWAKFGAGLGVEPWNNDTRYSDTRIDTRSAMFVLPHGTVCM